jgi:SAM-dependent methyltransferase
LSAAHHRRPTPVRPHEHSGHAIASAYNESGDNYISYVDGNPSQLFSFDGQYAYGDRCIWETLFGKLCALRASGARSIRVLDLGCGPGTWLRRVVARARALGFTSVVARGFDIAGDQVRRAQQLAADLADTRGVRLTFEVGDIFEPLLESDASVDLCLCLSSVLNHLPASDLPAILSEIARVTAGGYFIATVRSVGSTPSVYVDAIEHARQFRQDNQKNRLDVEFDNGRHISLPSHLYGATELRTLVAPYLEVADLCGLDLFHGRFAGDLRWNPDRGVNPQFAKELERLERAYCRDTGFIDYATHMLLVSKSRSATPTRKVRRMNEGVRLVSISAGSANG